MKQVHKRKLVSSVWSCALTSRQIGNIVSNSLTLANYQAHRQVLDDPFRDYSWY